MLVYNVKAVIKTMLNYFSNVSQLKKKPKLKLTSDKLNLILISILSNELKTARKDECAIIFYAVALSFCKKKLDFSKTFSAPRQIVGTFKKN